MKNSKDAERIRWQKKQAEKLLKEHSPCDYTMFGGTDDGCRKAIAIVKAK